jgi:hypothetical protein
MRRHLERRCRTEIRAGSGAQIHGPSLCRELIHIGHVSFVIASLQAFFRRFGKTCTRLGGSMLGDMSCDESHLL